MPPASDLNALLDYLKRSRGFDFTGYKPASLERRLQKRMQSVNVADYPEYLDYLEVHPEEFAALFNTVLINVTTFFRDPQTWEYVTQTVMPSLLARIDPTEGIRVWSAGCASGEEAYTLAMVFAEALGAEAFRDRVKIYATDLDEEALAKARQASYSESDVSDVPPELLARYFEPIEGRFVFRKDLRRQVIFGRHDLIQDAPISRIDLLVCRNTLMYFNAETQARILARFQFALNDYGVLILGRAETLMTHAATFAPMDLKRRISTKLPTAMKREAAATVRRTEAGAAAVDAIAEQSRVWAVALDASPTAQLLVDVGGRLLLANERARVLFGISRGDIGRPIQDLRISYRPVELRSALDEVFSDRRAVSIRDVEWATMTGDLRSLDVQVLPLLDAGSGEILGASVTFLDVSTTKRLQRDLEHANQELETAYEELQSTNEELETTNEELQSTVEELETTNEELQSTNEELETMNEELQSTNEELQSMNDELRLRGEEHNRVNAFLESILSSQRGAVIVVDPELRVLLWNHLAEDMWGLRETEVREKHLLGLDVGLPTEVLKQPIRACLTGEEASISLEVDAVNRRGRPVTCQVTITPLLTRSEEIRGAILLIENCTPATDGAAAGSAGRATATRSAKQAEAR